MAAYLIGHITIKDPVQWKIYVEADVVLIGYEC